jgi:LacI family transcriptional regulator
MKSVSLKDIAKMAGVAPSTVSFVLNGKARQMRISETLENKIMGLATKFGYHPNQVAVSLRTGKSKILGLVVESISGNFFAALAKVIEDEAERNGYKVVYCSTENDSKKGRELLRMLSHRQVDGYLITPTQGMEKDIQELAEQQKPLVLMDSFFPGVKVPYVLVDNNGGVTEGMEHLLKKGYRKIGFVTIDLDLEQMKQRENAYSRVLKSHKISSSKKLILKLPYNLEKEQSIKQIMSFLQQNKDMDAIFFATNYLGIAGLESIRRLNLSIPKDIAMICFDDHDLFRLYPPGITSIQQPIEAIAKTAIQLLMQQLAKNKMSLKSSQIHLPPHFIPRGST